MQRAFESHEQIAVGTKQQKKSVGITWGGEASGKVPAEGKADSALWAGLLQSHWELPLGSRVLPPTLFHKVA